MTLNDAASMLVGRSPVMEEVRAVVEQKPAPRAPTTLETGMEAERQSVEKALQQSGGNRTAVARILGISRRTMFNKLAELGLAESTATGE